MPLALKPLNWDSEHFQLTIGRIEGEPEPDADWPSLLAGFECVYWLRDTPHPPAEGFQLVDVRCTLVLPASSSSPQPQIRLACPQDLPALEQMVAVNHRDSRFFVDRRFDPNRAADLFRIWIQKSLSAFDHSVWVAISDEAVCGYVTLSGSTIGLFGVASHHRGKGLGHQLLSTASSYCAESGLEHLHLSTQGRNTAALSMYRKVGFTVERTEYWFHWWRDSRP